MKNIKKIENINDISNYIFIEREKKSRASILKLYRSMIKDTRGGRKSMIKKGVLCFGLIPHTI